MKNALKLSITLMTCLMGHPVVFAQSSSEKIQLLLKNKDEPEFQTKLKKVLDEYQANPPTDAATLSQLSAAAAVYANYFYHGVDKEKLMEMHYRGMTYAERSWTKEPQRVDPYFWYVLNLGYYALAKGIFSALNHAKKMLEVCNLAIEKDPSFESGGPYRVRAALYYDVPSVISFGDKKQALKDIQTAMTFGPQFPWNLLYLAKIQRTEVGKEQARKTFEQASQIPAEMSNIEKTRFQKELSELKKDLY